VTKPHSPTSISPRRVAIGLTLCLVLVTPGCASAPPTLDDLRRVYFEGACERFIAERSESRARMEVSEVEATDLDLMEGFCLRRLHRGAAAKASFEAIAAREPRSYQTAEAASMLLVMETKDEFGPTLAQHCDFKRAQQVLAMRSIIGNRRVAYFQLLQEVAPDGSVGRTLVLRSRSDGGLDDAVKEDAAGCRYAPIAGQSTRYVAFFVHLRLMTHP
jgi:hypothetical protein